MPLERPRVSIKFLMISVAGIGLGVAGLCRPTQGWALLASLLLWLFVLTGILGAILRSGESRGFWLGVAVFGGCYLALFLCLFLKDQVSGPSGSGDSVKMTVVAPLFLVELLVAPS